MNNQKVLTECKYCKSLQESDKMHIIIPASNPEFVCKKCHKNPIRKWVFIMMGNFSLSKLANKK